MSFHHPWWSILFARARRFLLSIILLASASPLLGSPSQYPKRVINGQVADLTPLFHWWTNQNGSRPLHSWAHLTGAIVATNQWGWIVEGHSDMRQAAGDKSHGESNSQSIRMLLRNPPTFQKAEFEQLSSQLQELKRERAQLTTEETNAKDQATTLAHNGARSRAKNVQVRQAKAIESEAGREVKQLDVKIGEVKKRLAVYPAGSAFHLDCFALFTGATIDRLPAYDFGLVAPK